MLSQEDRRRLDAIEHRFEVDDPRFVSRMRRPYRIEHRRAVLAASMAMLTAIVIVGVAGGGWLTVVAAGPVTVAAVVLIRGRRPRPAAVRRWRRGRA